MGYSLALFTSPPPIFARCASCEQVLENPLWVCSKDHAECKECYNNSDRGCSTCAELGQEQEGAAFIAREASFVKRVVEELEIICANKRSGCQWKGKVGKGHQHGATCGYATVVCPNQCGVVMLVKDRSAHRRSVCPLQKLACRRGIVDGEPKCVYLSKDASEHDESCQHWQCSVNGCSTRGPRAMIQAHEEECSDLHEELSDALEKIETMATEHEEERQLRDEAFEELEQERDCLVGEAGDYEDSLAIARGELYTVARRLRTLEEHLGLEPTVDVDEYEATLIDRPRIPNPPPAPQALGLNLAQPAAPSADWTQIDDFDLRPVDNLSTAQAKLHTRLVRSFKAKEALEEAEEAAKEAAMESADELGDDEGVGDRNIFVPIPQPPAPAPRLPPTPPVQEEPAKAALQQAQVNYCTRTSIDIWGTGPHVKSWIVDGKRRSDDDERLMAEIRSAVKKPRIQR